MKPTTIRLPEDLLEELDAEADEHDFHTRTEYLRYLIDHRDLVVSIALEQRQTRMDALADRVADLEERLEAVEGDQPDPAEPATEGVPSADELELDGDAESTEADEGTGTSAGSEPPQPETLEPLPDLETDEAEAPDSLELSDPGPEDVEERAAGLEFFAPTREIRREREAAVVAAWETLVEYAELTREEFEELVFDDHTAAFSTFEGWYDRLLVPALEQFDDVERADEDTWRYVGDHGTTA